MKKIVRTPDFPIVETKQGKLHGYLQDDVYHFHGIRYGTAERFELPELEQPWKGIRPAVSFGYICPLMPDGMHDQTAVIHDPSDRDKPMTAPFCSFEMPHVYWPMDEQCLYLNIWTKHMDPAAKRPVLLWLHGGGYGAGSSVELPSYDGHNFSDYGDVVFVSLNHRLNCLGFLDLSSFGEAWKYTGCLGMMDVVLALRWVRDNIASFGGDPDNITVAGQSGGGGKACMLLQMPAADGLYHKVISQSGALVTRQTKTLQEEKEYWQELGRRTVQELGLDSTCIDRIRTVPYKELSEAAERAGRTLDRQGGMMLLEPSPVEGLYTGPYNLAGFRQETADVPCIAGTVLGEFQFMNYLGNKEDYGPQEKELILRKNLPHHTDQILQQFRRVYPDKDILYAMSVDTMFRPATLAWLDSRARYLREQGKDNLCWNYIFSLIVPYLGGISLYHCGDIPFAFRNTGTEHLLCTLAEAAPELSGQVSRAWVNFMETGDPSCEELPWKPYTSEGRERMQFDLDCGMAREKDDELLNALLQR